MLLRTRCELTFDISVATLFIFMLRPRSGSQQWVVSEEYRHTPSLPVLEFTDSYGNLCQRLVAMPGAFTVTTLSDVIAPDEADTAPGAEFIEIQFLPDAVLSFLLPSRYCESDLFCAMATSITLDTKPGYDQVTAIVNWLRDNIRYESNASEQLISAADVNTRRSGVCRDFAHLGIALCRSINIPSRLVVGYLYGLEPMDFHAWFEAFVGGRWYTFDASQPKLTGGYIVVGYGRDAADVAVFNQFGPSAYPTLQSVDVQHIVDASEAGRE